MFFFLKVSVASIQLSFLTPTESYIMKESRKHLLSRTLFPSENNHATPISQKVMSCILT